ncbi:MAG: hypothetical protein GY816_02485 [Cytophagales bacterium]|nr:hypothetical protein [Cytophagales bacterium]
MREILFIVLVIGGLFAKAQDQTQQPVDSIPLELQKKIFIYNASRQYNDPVVNRMALYNLLAENPNNYALRDSLAILYLQQQEFASAALVAQEVASVIPDNMFATEIAATAFERLGVKNRALSFYEILYLNDSDNLGFLYKIAFLQYDLKLVEEAMASAIQIESKEMASETMLIFPTADKNGQEVSMKLGAARLKGMVEELRDDREKAKEYYEEVLRQMPEFEVVKQQLVDLDK